MVLIEAEPLCGVARGKAQAERVVGPCGHRGQRARGYWPKDDPKPEDRVLLKRPESAGASDRARRALLIVTVSALALTGCQQLKETGAYVGDKASAAGRYVGEKVSETTSAVGRWASGRPPDDLTACYATERVAFYDAIKEVKNAQSAVFAAGFAALIGAAVTTYSSSIATQLIAAGFAATMVGLIADITSDQTRIENVTTTFDALMACRRQEANAIKADVAAQRLTRTDGEAAMAKLRTLIAEDVEAAREVNQTLQQRTAEFQLSAEEAKKEAANAPTPEERQEHEQEVEKAEAAVQTNQQAVSQQSATIEQAAVLEQSDEFELGRLDDPSSPAWPVIAA
jgi:hypothetical protein